MKLDEFEQWKEACSLGCQKGQLEEAQSAARTRIAANVICADKLRQVWINKDAFYQQRLPLVGVPLCGGGRP